MCAPGCLTVGWMLSVRYNFWWILNLTVCGSHLSNEHWSLVKAMYHEYLSGTVSKVCLRSVLFSQATLEKMLCSAPGLNPTVYFTDVCF